MDSAMARANQRGTILKSQMDSPAANTTSLHSNVSGGNSRGEEEAMKELFSMSATRYYQVLNALVDRPERWQPIPCW